MRPDEYREFVADVAQHGLTTPLDVTGDWVVLDGRHRLRAARELGLEQVPVRLIAPDDEVEYIVRAATKRRHLNASQRAAIAIELEEYQLARDRAVQRQRANLLGSAEVAPVPPREGRTRDSLARKAETSPRTAQQAISVHQADPALFAQIKSGDLSAKKAYAQLRRAQRYQQIPPAPPLPDGPFELIYADPPWQMGNPHSESAPEQHYPTLPLEEIRQLAIPAADAAVLFLWVPSGLLPQGLDVMAAWGFEYRTELVWDKGSGGHGQWVRNRHEPLLLGRRGNFPLADPRNRPESVIKAPRRRHSEKPKSFHELLERMYPDHSKLELFARGTPRPGWAAWGNEVEQLA